MGALRLVAAVLLLAPASRAGAQEPLSLRVALARADRLAFPNRLATAQVARADADRTASLAGVIPAARIEMGYTRSTDPLVAFGFQLRQRTVTSASFDHLVRDLLQVRRHFEAQRFYFADLKPADAPDGNWLPTPKGTVYG